MKINPYKIIEKYYKKDSLAYNFVVIHSEMVTQKAIEIAKNINTHKIDLDFLEEACMLHDIGIFMVNAPRLGCFGNRSYVEHGYLGAELLKKEGLYRHAEATERHIGVGLSKQEIINQKIDIPQIDMVPLSIEEELVCFADNFYSKIEGKLKSEKNLEEIRIELAKYGEHRKEKFNEWLLKFNYFGYEGI